MCCNKWSHTEALAAENLNEENKEKFEKYLKNSIKENATQIYNDKIIADKFNLHWYRNIKEYSGEKINVYII